MAKSKVDVLVRISEVNLARARKRFDSGEYDSAVFHASMAVESAANAMILYLGGSEAKNHRAVSGLATVLRRVSPGLLRKESFAQLIERGREIQREVIYTRYPHKVDGQWLTPAEYYTREKAEAAIGNAEFVVCTIRDHLIEQ